MLYLLILVCTLLSLAISLIAMWFFSKSINTMLSSVLPVDLASAWSTFMRYMIVVIGLGGGVSIYHYKDYLQHPENMNWVIEIYDTILNTLSSIGWLVFWLFALTMIAYILSKIIDRKKSTQV